MPKNTPPTCTQCFYGRLAVVAAYFGFAASFHFAVILIPVSRDSKLWSAVGIPFERAVLYHAVAGHLAFTAMFMHAFLCSSAWAWKHGWGYVWTSSTTQVSRPRVLVRQARSMWWDLACASFQLDVPLQVPETMECKGGISPGAQFGVPITYRIHLKAKPGMVLSGTLGTSIAVNRTIFLKMAQCYPRRQMSREIPRVCARDVCAPMIESDVFYQNQLPPISTTTCGVRNDR